MIGKHTSLLFIHFYEQPLIYDYQARELVELGEAKQQSQNKGN